MGSIFVIFGLYILTSFEQPQTWNQFKVGFLPVHNYKRCFGIGLLKTICRSLFSRLHPKMILVSNMYSSLFWQYPWVFYFSFNPLHSTLVWQALYTRLGFSNLVNNSRKTKKLTTFIISTIIVTSTIRYYNLSFLFKLIPT